ncbi:MAG: hypothetical protein ACI9W2_003761 [Gammaproteobacteria bacterium]|jgi:hypothetical protein
MIIGEDGDFSLKLGANEGLVLEGISVPSRFWNILLYSRFHLPSELEPPTQRLGPFNGA